MSSCSSSRHCGSSATRRAAPFQLMSWTWSSRRLCKRAAHEVGASSEDACRPLRWTEPYCRPESSQPPRDCKQHKGIGHGLTLVKEPLPERLEDVVAKVDESDGGFHRVGGQHASLAVAGRCARRETETFTPCE
eukprot:3958301-Prymnesium_polylepis.2